MSRTRQGQVARLNPAGLGRRVGLLLAAASLTLLAGCSALPSWMGGSDKVLAPAELGPNPNLIGVRQAWVVRLAKVEFPLSVQASDGAVTVAGSDGVVAALDPDSGAVLWRAQAGGSLSAGVGSDGRVAAVVTRDNELVALSAGQTLWRQNLGAQSFTAPLVAGGRVFVLAADRTVLAFDARTGARLWTSQRPGDPLVLRQAGVLLAVGDQLVAGQGGRLAGLNPNSGAVRWEAPIANSRGTNDIERLVDLVGRVSRVGNSVCARAFQAAVGCVDASRGVLQWTQKAQGIDGVHGDERQVFGSESDGKVIAWNRATGERAWSTDRLLRRGLSAPLLVGRSVAVGDAFGFVHLLSREDGSLMQRLATDGSPIAAAPVRAGNTLVVVTRNGGVHGFVPE